MVKALHIFDIILLSWFSILDILYMKVHITLLALFLLVSIGFAVYKKSYHSIAIGLFVYLALKVVPDLFLGCTIGEGDQLIFGGLAIQFGLIPVTIIIALTFVFSEFIMGAFDEIPLIPFIFAAFLIVLHYTDLLD